MFVKLTCILNSSFRGSCGGVREECSPTNPVNRVRFSLTIKDFFCFSFRNIIPILRRRAFVYLSLQCNCLVNTVEYDIVLPVNTNHSFLLLLLSSSACKVKQFIFLCLCGNEATIKNCVSAFAGVIEDKFPLSYSGMLAVRSLGWAKMSPSRFESLLAAFEVPKLSLI